MDSGLSQESAGHHLQFAHTTPGIGTAPEQALQLHAFERRIHMFAQNPSCRRMLMLQA
jgi:hypothetical protein